MSRTLKYLAAGLVVVAIAAAVIHYKRESIAREIANSALRGRGLTATDLSIDTLGTDRILLSQLVLVGDDGARYELYDLSFPLNFPSSAGNSISIGALNFIPAETPGAPRALAGLLQSFLALPENLPDTELTISRFSTQDLPPLDDLAWRSVGDGQRLSFRVAALNVSAVVTKENEALRRVGLRATSGAAVEALSLDLSISRGQDGYSIQGPAYMQLAPMLPLLHALGVVPAEVAALDAASTGSVSAILPDAAELQSGVALELAVDGPLSARYAPAAGPLVDMRGTGLELLSLHVSYPALEWTAALAQGEFLINTATLKDFPVRLSDLACRPGITCTMHVAADHFALAVDESRIGNLQMSGNIELQSADETVAQLSPGFRVLLSGLETAGGSAASMDAHFASGAALRTAAGTWSADAERLELLLTEISNGVLQVPALPASLSALRIEDGARRAEFGFGIAARAALLRWGGIAVETPAVTGKVQLDDGKGTATIELSDPAGALSARLDGRYELAAGRGSIALQEAAMHFDRQPLSAWLPEWQQSWDVVSGTWSANGNVEFAAEGDGWTYEGTLAQGVSSLAGYYNDIVFTGLEAELPARMSSETGIEVPPSSLTLALLDVGIPIEQLSAAFAPDIAGQSLEVSSLSMTTLGGTVTADPFRFDRNQENNRIMLRPQSIQLQFMVDLAEFDNIEMSGSLSGALPVTISSETITVTGGRLESDPPGGVIHYGSGAATEVIVDDSIGLVSRALGNFQFDSLTSDVDYTEAGDLKLQMRLSGINPDMDPTQPVILNLGVENNVPQLLRSLQATRAIEDLLQRKAND